MINFSDFSNRFFQRPRTLRFSRTALRLALVIGIVSSSAHVAFSETLLEAMIRAYYTNPELNKERASVRATDEDVVQALAGYKPSISASASLEAKRERTRTTGRSYPPAYTSFFPHNYSLKINQTLFDGNKTKYLVGSVEARIIAARESLHAQEQNILLGAVTAYMDALRDKALLNLRKNNVKVIQHQLDQTQQRFAVGEVTRTDVYQAKARLAEGRSLIFVAEASYAKSLSDYQRVIGSSPENLQNVSPRAIEKFLPKTLEKAIKISQRHPILIAAVYGVDAQKKDVLSKKGELSPVLSVSLEAGQQKNLTTVLQDSFFGTVRGSLTFPIYQGGRASSRVRQSKERLTGLRDGLETTRRAIIQNITRSWSELLSAKARLSAVATQIKAAKIALSGIKEETKAGTRTTLDVLNAERDVLDAEVSRIAASRERIVQSYTLLRDIGQLSFSAIGVKTALYDPKIHYREIRHRWFGVDTPSEQRKKITAQKKPAYKQKLTKRKSTQKRTSLPSLRELPQKTVANPSPTDVMLPEIQIPGELSAPMKQPSRASFQKTSTRSPVLVMVPNVSSTNSTLTVKNEIQRGSEVIIESSF